MPKNNIPRIQLSEDQTDSLKKRVREMIVEAEELHSNWSGLHNSYLRQYLCIPDEKEENWPWKGSANVFLPLTRVVTDGILSQEFDAMFANEPSVRVLSYEGSDLRDSELLSQWYGEYVWREVVNLRNLAYDWLLDNAIDGTAAVRPRFNRSKKLARSQFLEQKLVTEKVTESLLGLDMQAEVAVAIEETWTEEARVERQDQLVVDVCDMERIFIAPSARVSTRSFGGLQYPDCPWYYVEFNLTWEELLERRREGYNHIDEALKARLAETNLTERERTQRRSEELSESRAPLTTRVFEVYMRWPLPCSYLAEDGETVQQDGLEEDFWEEIVITWLADTEEISRIVPLSRVSPNGKRPDIDNRYQRLPRFFYGMGVPAKLNGLNAIINSSYNQMLDFGTLANMPWALFEPATTGLLPENLQISPGAFIPVRNARGVVFPKFNYDPMFHLRAMQQVQAWAERDGNISDFNTGTSPDRPNAPDTARATLALLQQSNIAFGRLIAMHAEAFVELFRAVHAHYRRYAPDNLVFRIFNQDKKVFQRKTLSRESFNQDLDFQFVLNPNRAYEQQTNQLLFQLMLRIPWVGQNPRAVRALARQLYDSMGKKNFEEIWPEQMTYQIEQAMAAQSGQSPPEGQGQQPSPAAGQPGAGLGLEHRVIEEEETDATVRTG